MNIYISMDMEGLAGTFNWEQEDSPDRKLIRKAMEDQLQWVIEGIQQSPMNGQVKEITVADSHGRGDTITYGMTEKDERLHLVSGCPRPEYMMPAMSKDYDQVFLLGYHGAAGSRAASMDHTYSSRSIARLELNGKAMTEAQINAIYAGSLGVPVTLITGDEALRRQLTEDEFLKDTTFVVTKEAIARFSCKSRPMAKVRQETIDGVKSALQRSAKDLIAYELKGPYEMKIELTTSSKADVVDLMPSFERIGPKTVRLIHDDYKKVFNSIMAVTLLACHGRL